MIDDDGHTQSTTGSHDKMVVIINRMKSTTDDTVQDIHKVTSKRCKATDNPLTIASSSLDSLIFLSSWRSTTLLFVLTLSLGDRWLLQQNTGVNLCHDICAGISIKKTHFHFMGFLTN